MMPGFDLTTLDSYFMTLVEVFTNHISVENTFQESYRMDRTQDLNLQKGTKLFGNHPYQQFPSSISLSSKSYVNTIFYRAEYNELQTQDS